LQVTLAEQGRAADLVLDAPLPCGPLRVRIIAARDDQGGRFIAPDDAVTTTIACPQAAFAVHAVQGGGSTIDVRFSRGIDAATATPAAFEVRWDTIAIAVAAATLHDSMTVRLTLDRVLVGRGSPVRIRVAPSLRARDGATLARPDQEYWLRIPGAGARHVFAAPNPVRAGVSEVVFAEAQAATRVRVYDLEGELVADLSGGAGGAVRWNLRDRGGRQVASGTYVFIAEDASGAKRGHLVVAR
jgi:hypothetical protein